MEILVGQDLKQTNHDRVVQRDTNIVWAGAEAVRGTVTVAGQRPTLDQFTQWVEQVGGRMATDDEIAQI